MGIVCIHRPTTHDATRGCHCLVIDHFVIVIYLKGQNKWPFCRHKLLLFSPFLEHPTFTISVLLRRFHSSADLTRATISHHERLTHSLSSRYIVYIVVGVSLSFVPRREYAGHLSRTSLSHINQPTNVHHPRVITKQQHQWTTPN